MAGSASPVWFGSLPPFLPPTGQNGWDGVQAARGTEGEGKVDIGYQLVA